ncbi:MAG: endonuclease V [Nanoarchaeota archaeon]
MDLYELKREQQKLASKIILEDGFEAIDAIKTIGGAECVQVVDSKPENGQLADKANKTDKILAAVVVCEFPSLKLKEYKTYLLDNPLPYKPGFQAYREMPAIIEAYNLLEEEPDILLVAASGIAHPRKIGMASHLGLALNEPTIGVTERLLTGIVEEGKVLLGGEVVGFELKTKEFAKPVYVSPGHLISPQTALNIVQKTIIYPHKMPEPLHIAHKIARKIARKKDVLR